MLSFQVTNFSEIFATKCFDTANTKVLINENKITRLKKYFLKKKKNYGETKRHNKKKKIKNNNLTFTEGEKKQN